MWVNYVLTHLLSCHTMFVPVNPGTKYFDRNLFFPGTFAPALRQPYTKQQWYSETSVWKLSFNRVTYLFSWVHTCEAWIPGASDRSYVAAHLQCTSSMWWRAHWTALFPLGLTVSWLYIINRLAGFWVWTLQDLSMISQILKPSSVPQYSGRVASFWCDGWPFVNTAQTIGQSFFFCQCIVYISRRTVAQGRKTMSKY